MGASTDDNLQQWLDSPPEGVSGDTLHHHAMRRIRQLEKQCEVLSAEVDRQRPVVEAAQVLARSLRRHPSASWSGTEELLERRVSEYEASNPK